MAHVEAETFAASCAEASSRPGGWEEVRGRFRRLDLLVVDDLQSLERTPWAMIELAHTLDALDEAGAAVAVAARTGPGGWSGWPVRLVSRLTAGLAVGLDRPSVESRRRYLLDRARSRGLAVPIEAVEPLAAAADGYRTLDGWLARLALSARLDRSKVPVADLVASILAADPVTSGPPGRTSGRSPGRSRRPATSGSATSGPTPAAPRSPRPATWRSTWPGRIPRSAFGPSAPTSAGVIRPRSATRAGPPRPGSPPTRGWRRSSPPWRRGGVAPPTRPGAGLSDLRQRKSPNRRGLGRVSTQGPRRPGLVGASESGRPRRDQARAADRCGSGPRSRHRSGRRSTP